MIDRLLNMLLVKRDELGTLLLLGANLFLATLALIVSQIVAETLFLSAYGGDVLVYIYMVNGVGAVAAGAAYGWLQGKTRAGLFEMVMVMLFAMLFVMLWIGIDGAPQWMLIVLMVFAEIFGTLIILQAWNTNGALLTSRQAKRLMPLISGFGTIAGILSGLLVGSLAGPLGTVNLIGLVVVALMIMAALSYPLAKRLCVSMERIAPKPKAEAGTRRFGGAIAVFGNRHVQVILAMTAVATLTSMLVDYQFKVFSQAHYTVDGALQKDRLSTFYGQLQVVISTLALVLQFGMASRVLERFGIAMTLALLPAVILTGALGIVLGIGSYFAAATLSRSGDKVLKFSLYGSTNQMLFMALPGHLQKTTRTLSNAIVRPATFILAGVLLIFVTQGAGMNDAAVGWLTGAMALVWIVLSVTAERGYLMSMLNVLAQNRIQFHTDQIEITDPEAIEQVRAQLRAEDPERVVNSLEIAKRIKGVDIVDDVVAMLRHADPRVRAAAVGFVAQGQSGDQRSVLVELLENDTDSNVRANAARAIFKLGGPRDPKDLSGTRSYLEDRDLPVRVIALSIFLASEHDEERKLGDSILATLAASELPEERLAALDAVMNQNAQTCMTTVLGLLEDPVPEVRCRAALTAAAVNCPGVWGTLLGHLREDRLQPMELAALGQADASIVPQLREMLLDAGLPIRVRRQSAQILGRIGGDEALAVLLERLHRPLLTVPLDAARAASRIVRSTGQPLPRERVAKALDLLYEDAYQITAALADFDESPLRDHVAVATLVLRRRLRRVLETLYNLLSLTYPADVIDIAVNTLGSEDRRQLDAAIEVINQALEREDRNLVIPLIEAESPAASLSAAAKRIEVTRRDGEQRIERWLRHADPWRSTAALWTTADAQLERLREKVRDHLSSDHAVVRETAALAAWKIEPEDQRRALLEPLLQDPAASIRELVGDLLGNHHEPTPASSR